MGKLLLRSEGVCRAEEIRMAAKFVGINKNYLNEKLKFGADEILVEVSSLMAWEKCD